MKVIFLDIDGVLNSEKFWTEISQSGRWIKAEKEGRNRDEQSALANIDRNAVDLLNRIVKETDAEIVISSTWKNDINLPYKLRYMGLIKPYYGITPYSNTRHRGTDIELWLDLYKEDNTEIKYVILDDDTDMLEEQMPFFIHTDFRVGLTEQDVKKAIEILKD